MDTSTKSEKHKNDDLLGFPEMKPKCQFIIIITCPHYCQFLIIMISLLKFFG